MEGMNMFTDQSIKLPLTLQRKPFERTVGMSKLDYVERIAQDNRPRRLPKEAIKEIVDDTFEFIIESLRRHKKFTYSGFGSFRLKTRKAKTGVHPNTGEKCAIPSRQAISFLVSDKLKKNLK